MLKVNRKPQETKAVQWTGWNLMEVLTFIEGQLDSPENEEHFERFNELQEDYRNGILPFKIGFDHIKVGEWIVDNDGRRVLLSNEEFKNSFEKV